MSEKSVLEMVGGEKHLNPHYNIKAEIIGSYWEGDKRKMSKKLNKKDNELIIQELLMELDVAKGLLEKWYKQYSDKTYTEMFYKELVKNTDVFLYRSENARI